MAKKRVRKKLEKFDGLGPLEKKKIRIALRLVWHRSHPRKVAVQRASLPNDFFRCENPTCRKKVPKICVDHIKPCGEVDSGFIKRLFVPSKGLQCLCKNCHKIKTRQDREGF